jgi:hypothetical protein
MIDACFWVPRKLRPPKVHQPRNRRACLGELVQIDRSDHAWFEDQAPGCTWLVYVDGTSLPYTNYDRFPEVDQGAIIDLRPAR